MINLNVTVRQACRIYSRFGEGDGNRRMPTTDEFRFCREAAGHVDRLVKDNTIIFLQVSWLSRHKAGNQSFITLLTACAEVVNRAKSRKAAVLVAPIHIA